MATREDNFFPNDNKLRLTEEEVDILLSALKKASGGIPKTDIPKVLWDKLTHYSLFFKKKKTKNIIIRLFFMPNRPPQRNENVEFTEAQITYHRVSQKPDDPSGIPEDCPVFDYCLEVYKGCLRENNQCPDAITEAELKASLKGKKSEFEKWLDKILKKGNGKVSE